MPARTLFRWLLALFFVAAGANHFRIPEFYIGIVPRYFPFPRELVYLTGIAEILGGIGIGLPKTRWVAGWGLIALLVAVLPVHFQMAMRGFGAAPPWLLWARLFLQFLFILWVHWTCIGPKVRHAP